MGSHPQKNNPYLSWSHKFKTDEPLGLGEQEVCQRDQHFSQSARAAIALGSNLGDSLTILESALDILSQTAGIRVEARSHWYRTKAVGPPQPDYLNGCALLKVDLTPQELLQTLLQTEATFGRVRRERNGPRTLDLDLLLFDDVVLDVPGLQIPHPRMTERAFVLVPLAEIAPNWVEPSSRKAIAAIAQTVDYSGVEKLVKS